MRGGGQAPAKIQLQLKGLHKGQLKIGDRIRAIGTVKPFVGGQRVFPDGAVELVSRPESLRLMGSLGGRECTAPCRRSARTAQRRRALTSERSPA